MIKRIKNILAALSVSMAFAMPVAMPALVHAEEANIPGNLCAGASLNVNGTCDDTSGTAAKEKVNNILTTVINIFSLVVGVVAVIMIIIGGLKYITSGGDSGNITGAKNTILYAIIGLVVVALAQVVVKFVLAKTTQ